jgi:hypothetical protein
VGLPGSCRSYACINPNPSSRPRGSPCPWVRPAARSVRSRPSPRSPSRVRGPFARLRAFSPARIEARRSRAASASGYAVSSLPIAARRADVVRDVAASATLHSTLETLHIFSDDDVDTGHTQTHVRSLTHDTQSYRYASSPILYWSTAVYGTRYERRYIDRNLQPFGCTVHLHAWRYAL